MQHKKRPIYQLANYRTDLEKTQKQMASVIGVSESIYKLVESGNRTPSYNFIRKFHKAYPTFNLNIFFDEHVS
ncbi:helix-turn-helix domain-containing protein [Vallitalea guaymasensis]|uniref:helix-turn-helix domain-containing protein n=1 Tax=Vallitalea guaymasensis TaxID=1185412 RepID=UPI000DE51B10|nr:helix-turn-helix transcriptional regulator [Vallitalea guaymasensis]